MNRKLITKGLLFKYLHDRKISSNLDLSKHTLIEKILRHWTDTFSAPQQQPQTKSPETAEPRPNIFDTFTPATAPPSNEHFPIHQMARQFTAWFFEQYNQNHLSTEDFWSDARGQVEMVEQPNCVQEERANDAQSLVDILMGLKQRFAMFFNPNVSHAGIQGRIDAHGLVLVLGCGTLHAPHGVVGCFECVFGLIRDPFTDNNWKVKHMKMRLNGSAAAVCASGGGAAELGMVDLQRCETLQPMLALPAGEMDLE